METLPDMTATLLDRAARLDLVAVAAASFCLIT